MSFFSSSLDQFKVMQPMFYGLRIQPDRNIDLSPSKSFQGHTGPVLDLCEICIGKFQLLLTASSDLSVRVGAVLFFIIEYFHVFH